MKAPAVPREPTMRGKERAALRGEAHHLAVIVHVGHAGITPPVVASLDDALRTHELVKCQVAKKGELRAREAAPALAREVGADVVQVIGRTFTLYRLNPELHREARSVPVTARAPRSRHDGPKAADGRDRNSALRKRR